MESQLSKDRIGVKNYRKIKTHIELLKTDLVEALEDDNI